MSVKRRRVGGSELFECAIEKEQSLCMQYFLYLFSFVVVHLFIIYTMKIPVIYMRLKFYIFIDILSKPINVPALI